MGLISDYIMRDLPRPRWLAGKNGSAFLRSFCEVGDQVAQDGLDARAELDLTSATARSLGAHARNENDRTYPREALEDFRAYLLRHRAEKQKAGTTDGLHAQFARLGCSNVEIVRELDVRRAGAINGFGGNIGFFFVIIHLPHPFGLGAEWDGGQDWDDDVTLWDSAVSLSDQADIKDLLRRWKPTGTSCRFVVIDEDGTATWDDTGLHGSYSTFPINEAWEFKPPSGVVTPYYNTTFLAP